METIPFVTSRRTEGREENWAASSVTPCKQSQTNVPHCLQRHPTRQNGVFTRLGRTVCAGRDEHTTDRGRQASCHLTASDAKGQPRWRTAVSATSTARSTTKSTTAKARGGVQQNRNKKKLGTSSNGRWPQCHGQYHSAFVAASIPQDDRPLRGIHQSIRPFSAQAKATSSHSCALLSPTHKPKMHKTTSTQAQQCCQYHGLFADQFTKLVAMTLGMCAAATTAPTDCLCDQWRAEWLVAAMGLIRAVSASRASATPHNAATATDATRARTVQQR